MPRLIDLVSQKPRICSKRCTREGGTKRKTPADQSKEKSKAPEHEISMPEHKPSRTLEAPKKLEAPKLKWVVFKSTSREQIDTSKKQKLATDPEQRLLASTPEPAERRESTS